MNRTENGSNYNQMLDPSSKPSKPHLTLQPDSNYLLPAVNKMCVYEQTSLIHVLIHKKPPCKHITLRARTVKRRDRSPVDQQIKIPNLSHSAHPHLGNNGRPDRSLPRSPRVGREAAREPPVNVYIHLQREPLRETRERIIGCCDRS